MAMARTTVTMGRNHEVIWASSRETPCPPGFEPLDRPGEKRFPPPRLVSGFFQSPQRRPGAPYSIADGRAGGRAFDRASETGYKRWAPGHGRRAGECRSNGKPKPGIDNRESRGSG